MYLNKREKELLIVAREVVEAIRAIDGEDVMGSHYNLLFDSIVRDLQYHLNNYDELEWYSYFLGTTEISKVGKVGYGFLFFIKKGQTLDIIFVYGFANNIIPFESHSSFTKKYDLSWDFYMSDFGTTSLRLTNCKNEEDIYLFELLKMVSVKIFGNFYHINLDYPKLK